VWELNPQELLSSDGFQDRVACQMPNLPEFGRGDTGRTCIAQSELNAGLESAALPLCYTPRDDLLVHAVGLAPCDFTVVILIYSQALLPLSHAELKSVIVKMDEGYRVVAPLDTLRRTLLLRG
jgi:hypothetical protein